MTYMKTKRHIQTLVFTVLLFLAGGMVNSVSAVKYHILTLPFTVRNAGNTGDYKANIRVEALLVISDDPKVGLPDQYKSPLATNFRYYAAWPAKEYTYMYDYEHSTNLSNSKQYLYSGEGSGLIENPAETSSSGYEDIYVIYDYDDTKGITLNDTKDYNISVGGDRFLCLNRSRNNRPANANANALTGEHLASKGFAVPPAGTKAGQMGFNWSNDEWAGEHGVHFGFWLIGQDPYNITLKTIYEGDGTYNKDPLLGQKYYKPYKDATIFTNISLSGERLSSDKMWFACEHNIRYRGTDENNWKETANQDQWPGFFRNLTPIINAFAILKHPSVEGGYVFVASKVNQGTKDKGYTEYTPNKSGNYASFTKDNLNPVLKMVSLSSSPVINLYEVKTYTIKVKTHGSKDVFQEDMRWSDAKKDENIIDHIPEVLKRKYCTYKAYSDADLTNEITTFAQATSSTIWLDYTVSESMPIKTLAANGDYKDAQWYTMRMDGVANPKYIAYNDGDGKVVVTDDDGNPKGSNTSSQLHQGENSAEAMVAFMGDPYELKILNRKACETATTNRFIGCNTGSEVETTNLTTNNAASDITTWEIVYESIGETGMLLRQYNTAATPKYIGLGDATNNKPVTYSATSSRIRVVELDKKKYAFHIMRADKSIAVKATSSEEVGRALKGNYTDIPEIIRSPYLSSATVNFYATQADAEDDVLANKITNLPYDGSPTGTYADVWVRYSVTPSASTDYNVRVNSDYIYTNGSNIYSKKDLDPGDPGDPDDHGDAGKGEYQWTFNVSDPYALTIKNVKLSDGGYVNVSLSDKASITWGTTGTLFIAKSGNTPGTYEVMAATGDAIDASTEYYNIGRPEANTVKLYRNSSYLSGNATLRFQLTATTATDVTYHLIDMYNNELLKAKTRQATSDHPAFPPEYYSPLVDRYYYHKSESHAVSHRYEDDNFDTGIGGSEVYVTYDVNDLVNLKAGQLYLMKYEAGEMFYQEDGNNGLTTDKQKAIYPYVNGDGNFFVYGQEQYDLQQEGASSTRTRWAWYVESNVPGAPKGDPYHITIKSRQTETYPIVNSSEYNAYFMTYKPDGYSQVITTLGWPGMNSEAATEYMVLGSEGQYQLVTTNEISGARYVVDSFEQYWKTYDTIRRILLKQSKAAYPDADDDKITVQSTPCLVDGFDDNRTYLTTSTEASPAGLGWHSYEKWAYAKRWNGYNNGYSSEEGKHEAKKGWEKVEHWYQTVKMGEGYFDFVKTSIDPVLILLDQHGWEIMRKPIPSSPDDPEKEAKYAAIRPYNSPMVKEYAFWATAKKRTGFHQYYLLSDRIGGDDFTSTDLTNLPPYGSQNVKDKKGNLNDQYVTYIVKEEYAQTYQPGTTPTAKPFLIEQNHKYATTNADGSKLNATAIPNDGNMKAYILNGNIHDTEKWYLKPNVNIDNEMGYSDTTVPHNWDSKTPNGYEDSRYSTLKTSVYVKETDEYKNDDDAGKKALTDKFGQFSFSNGFDPYNIQIQSVGVTTTTKFMKTNANGAVLDEGSFLGSYPTNPGAVAMGNNTGTISPYPTWYDSRNLYVTNATFMAVQDAAGNMQLMPRFDHSTRMSEFGTLIAPTDAQVATTYTKLYRPEVYEYLIIDNDDHESLRYKTGGDMTPQIPDHFRSPLATNFTYYSKATKEGDTYTIDKTKEIEGSLDGATLTDNKVYVRYEYNEESDVLDMLKGNWLTMQLNEKNTIYNNGIKESGESKPETIDATKKVWQWKFTESPQSTPDPYALYIYNRNQIAGTKAVADRFALLSHSAGDYALAKAGRGDYDYYFLNGSSMSTSADATITKESGFTPTAGTFVGKNSQVKLTDDVQHTFTYKVYTNGGVNAIDANQTQEAVLSNEWKPVLPEAARTPLLSIDQFRYYEHTLEAGSIAEADTLHKALPNLYGLYNDIVYTHYTAYNPDESGYVVPNVRNTPTPSVSDDDVAPGFGSNDAPIGLDGKRPYNIIWYHDNMMQSNSEGTDIEKAANQELSANDVNEWEFEGEDPYAIKIKNVHANKYIHKATTETTEFSDTPTTFMLLNKDDHDYGVFAITGNASTMLSGYGNALTTSDPTKFIPFALSTFKVIYHLMIKNIGSEGVIIPYKEEGPGKTLDPKHWIKPGTTLRDLTSRDGTGGEETHIYGDKYQLGESLKAIGQREETTTGLFARDSIYCVDAGHVSLGDAFKVPQDFYRPNVSYDYYIEGVYSADGKSEITAMNDEYKGLKMPNLGEDSRLLGNIVFVNIVYNFMGGLDTNSGSDFVESVDQNKWYTFETSDATPMMADYTTMNGLKTVSGYATHYTNDYLWTPVGDPYGFKMYNRYMYKNLGEKKVMSTDGFANNEPIIMENDNDTKPYLPANSVYELLATSSTTAGYFRIHPVVNKDGTQFYMKNVVNAGVGEIKLNTAPTDFTFGLSEEVMKPYYQAAGYIGGLNAAGIKAYDEAKKESDPLTRLMAIQDVVYNHDNNNPEDDQTNPNYIVHYTPGYYRLHSQPGSLSITTPRYMSGYTHAIEQTAGAESTAIPLHFYEVEEYDMNNPTFGDLGTGNYTITDATRGDIPLVTVDKDPASIFQFTGSAGTIGRPSVVQLKTQGLNVIENKMGTGEATSYNLLDVGAGISLLYTESGDSKTFLNYKQTTLKYDLKYASADTPIESARWCLKPVQSETTAGEGEMPLKVVTKNGGDDYYYTTFYAPFDALLTSANDVAYIVPSGKWPTITPPETTAVFHPKKIGTVNTEPYAGNDQFIPAGTPVIIRTKNTGGEVTMVMPNATPSATIATALSGKYLEQMLAQDAGNLIYVFGRSYTHSDEFTYNASTGKVTPQAGLDFDRGVGFYKNANTNRESNETKTQWSRNNKYVYGNKAYYYAGNISGYSLNLDFENTEYIPVLFDDQGVKDMDLQPDGTMRLRINDGRAYDIQGRCVATEQEVSDGSWLNNVASGMYIVNGKKFVIE